MPSERPWGDGPLTVTQLELLIKCGDGRPRSKVSEREWRQLEAWERARDFELWGRWGRENPRHVVALRGVGVGR